jgi:hypothetical protein
LGREIRKIRSNFGRSLARSLGLQEGSPVCDSLCGPEDLAEILHDHLRTPRK